MATRTVAFALVMLVGLAGGCGGPDGDPGDPQPPPAAPAVAPSTAAPAIVARVSITTSGDFTVDATAVVLQQGDATATAATVCSWLGTAAIAPGQLHVFDCGALAPQPNTRDPLAALSLTLENLVAPAAGPVPTHEFTVSAITIDLVRTAIDGEESLTGQACALDERLGKPTGQQALPNLLRVQLGGDACAVVSRERYLNTVWLKVGGAPQGEFHKYLYAGQAPGARPFIGGFSDETLVAFDFVTPSVPAADVPIAIAMVNKPTAGQYDAWVLSAMSVRTGAGMLDLDLSQAIACTGGSTDASDIICWTDGGSLACDASNQCFR
jgi:hypothetical protein